ncbi:unnamed protein product, partial [Allacma fusca]
MSTEKLRVHGSGARGPPVRRPRVRMGFNAPASPLSTLFMEAGQCTGRGCARSFHLMGSCAPEEVVSLPMESSVESSIRQRHLLDLVQGPLPTLATNIGLLYSPMCIWSKTALSKSTSHPRMSHLAPKRGYRSQGIILSCRSAGIFNFPKKNSVDSSFHREEIGKKIAKFRLPVGKSSGAEKRRKISKKGVSSVKKSANFIEFQPTTWSTWRPQRVKKVNLATYFK